VYLVKPTVVPLYAAKYPLSGSVALIGEPPSPPVPLMRKILPWPLVYEPFAPLFETQEET